MPNDATPLAAKIKAVPAKRKTYYVMNVDDLDEWHGSAQEFKAYSAEDAAEAYVEFEGGQEDGDEIDVVVSEHKDGRERRAFRITAEVQVNYDVTELLGDDAADLDFPDDPNADPDDAPTRPVDKLTLPLFVE